MQTKTLKMQCGAVIGFIVIMGLALSPFTAAAASWSQGFEVNTDGWFDYPGPLTRVASGDNGIASYEGDYHATLGGGAFTRWGGYETTFPSDGYVTEVAVYLDMSEADGSDKRMDFSSAVSTPSDGHRRDFIFHLGTNPNVEGQWAASVSNSAPGWPLNPGRNPVDITESGWYLLRSTFEANENNVLVVTMEVLDANETVVGSWELSDESDVIGDTVGGNRYGWFIGIGVDELAIDASQKYDVVNNPATKQECMKGGWEDFGFSNQGQCVRFVETGKDSR